MKKLSLGFSPCPNDTFIFHGLVHGAIETSCEFNRPQLEDVETLNSWALSSRLDVTKLSFHALGHVLDDYCVLSSGSALGRGCGPLLVAEKKLDLQRGKQLKIAIPGKYTTAAMLFRMFAPQCSNLVEMRFDEIMKHIKNGNVDAGVIIHESRFTFENEGLTSLQDLGQWWEELSGYPIPLGCIVARRSFGSTLLQQIDRAIHDSLTRAFTHPSECLEYIRRYSQELDQKVIDDHIGLYVNSFSLNLGEEGRRAIKHFLDLGREKGILPECGAHIFASETYEKRSEI